MHSPDGTKRILALSKIENVVLMASVNVTSPIMVELLKKEIPLTWLSSTGEFYGRLDSTKGQNIERQRLQFRCADDEKYSLTLAKEFLGGKIKNCQSLLHYYKNWQINQDQETLDSYTKKIAKGESIEELMGYEGNAAKLYFKALGRLTKPPFQFENRTKQPPKDRFNSLLSFGYTLLTYEIYTALVNKGLNPYCSFLHKIRKGHPALASDLIEEWRPLIVDSLVMDLVRTHKIDKDDFDFVEDSGGVFLKRQASKEFITAFETKLKQKNEAMKTAYSLSFRESLQYQVELLVKSIESGNPHLYKAVLVQT